MHRNTFFLGTKDNQDFLCELDIVDIKCMFFLFWKLEWYIIFHTSCVLKNIFLKNHAAVAAYEVYLYSCNAQL